MPEKPVTSVGRCIMRVNTNTPVHATSRYVGSVDIPSPPTPAPRDGLDVTPSPCMCCAQLGVIDC